MSLEALLAELERSAETEEARIRAEADARVTSVLHASEEAIERRREAELARISAAEQQDIRRETAAIERSTRLAVLEARARLMALIFARTEADLAKADGPRYAATIPALVRAMLPYVEGRESTFRCRPDVASAVRGACGGESSVTVVVAPDCEAGILGESREGDLQVDSRLVSLLARQREDLAIGLARRLEAAE